MSGLNHDFALIATHNLHLIDSCYIFYHQEHLASEVVTLHDDFIVYFADSFQWLDSFNPSTKKSLKSLCYYGYTLFDKTTITKFKNIIKSWRSQFENAPSLFTLTGSWVEIVGAEKSGHYEKFEVNRDEILGKMDKLIAMCEQVETNENLVLLHGGI